MKSVSNLKVILKCVGMHENSKFEQKYFSTRHNKTGFFKPHLLLNSTNIISILRESRLNPVIDGK